MHSPFSLSMFAALAVSLGGLLPAHGDTPTWTTHSNIQYGELNRANKGASPNLVSLDVYIPEGLAEGERLPLVLMFHGGGWREGDKANTNVVQYKIPFFTGNGYIFASANYELSPAIKHPVHAQDVANAIAFLYENAGAYHIDPEKITIMGHSAGAQLVALVATDGQFLKNADQSTNIISKVILLDGIYDLPFRLRTDDRNNKKVIHQAFGTNPIVLRAASPVFQVKKSSSAYTPSMLNFFSDVPSKVKSDVDFIEKLRGSGVLAGGILCRKFTHSDVDLYVGYPDSPMNQPILDFLAGGNPQTSDGQIYKPGTAPE
jgi:arylformamidase